MPTNTTLKIDGQTIDATLYDVRLEQHIDRHHEMTLKLRRSGQVETGQDFESIDDYRGYLGRPMSLIFESDEIPDRADLVRMEFVYIITQISFDNGYDEINTVHLTAHSPTYLMDGSKRNKIWQEQSASDIIRAIVSSHSVTQGTIDATGTVLDYCVQYGETDYEFVQRLAAANGMFAFYDGQKFHVKKAAASSSVALKWGYSLAAFNVGVGTAVEKFEGAGYSRADKETFSGVTGSSLRQSLGGLAQLSHQSSKDLYSMASFVSGLVPTSQSQVDNAVEVARMSSIGRMVRAHGRTHDVPLNVSGTIAVSGFGSDIDANYYVLKVDHHWTSGGYECSFECSPMDAAHPAPHPKPRATDLQSAIVVSTDDPDNEGKLKVRFSWTVDGSPAEPDHWIRMVTPHAGNERGFFALPEVDDEVLVAFEGGDPDRPIVIGSLWNGKDKPPTDHPAGFSAPDNDLKVFRTKADNDLIFVDKEGSEALSLVQKDGTNLITLTMDGPKIMIESEGDISIKGKTVTIESTSGDVEIKSAAKGKFETAADLELKASGNLKAEGAMNFEGKGGVEAKISATTAKVEGSAMTEVKGGIVKIN